MSVPVLSIPLPPRLGPFQPNPSILEAALPSSPLPAPKLGCPGTYRWSRRGRCARSAGSCAMTVTLPPGWRPGCCRTAPRPGSCCGSAGSKAHAVRSSAGGNGPGRDLPTSLSPCLQMDPAGWVCSTVAPHHQTPLALPLWVHPKAFRHTGPSHSCPGHPSDGSEQQWRIAPPWGLLPVACTPVCHPPAPLPTEPWAAGNKLLLSASFCPISSEMSQLVGCGALGSGGRGTE